jgi:hypothetical protein
MNKDDLKAILADYDARMEAIGGCSDGYCMVTGPAKGMHTNGGCHCWMEKYRAQRVMIAARGLRKQLEELASAG